MRLPALQARLLGDGGLWWENGLVGLVLDRPLLPALLLSLLWLVVCGRPTGDPACRTAPRIPST